MAACGGTDNGVRDEARGGGVTTRRSAPTARTWLLAVLELVGAMILARVIIWSDPPAMQHGDHGMPMSGMAGAPVPAIHWTWPVYAAGAVAVVAAIWWWLRRQAVAAVACATAVTVCAASQPVRVLATQSHLISMVVLEALMVLVPLLALRVLPSPVGSSPMRSRGWMALVVGSAVAYSALLIVIHIPAVHHTGLELGAAPLWLALLAPVIGIGYWFGVLRTAAVVPTRARRASLLGAQEVAAFVGLLSLFGAWGTAAHHSALGIPASWDQRLGGLVMIATCAAAAIPIARRLR
jgi:hypothetical protein